MTLAAIAGALLAVVARPMRPPEEVELAAAKRQIKNLERDIDYLSRELDIQLAMVAHWKEQAQLMARLGRERREGFQLAQYQALQPVPPQDPQAALAQAYSQQNAALPQQLQNLAAQQAQGHDWGGFCNCVPSRAQVWAANQGEG